MIEAQQGNHLPTVPKPSRNPWGGGTSEMDSHGSGWLRRAAEQIGLQLVANGQMFGAFES